MRILCLLALIALSAAEQVVKTKDWRTTEVSIDSKSFTKIVDAEGRETSFYIKRLAPSKEDWVHDCYEVRLDNTGSASDYKFCYPSLHIAGMAQCGTSSLFQFFAQHEPIAAHLGKEHCPSTGLYDYFKSMAHAFEGMFAQKNVMAIGCINPDMLMLIHRLIAPKAVYVFSIRDLPQQRWSAYNFWCDLYLDEVCNVKNYWTATGMYRSPGMFDEMLRAINYPDQHRMKQNVGIASCTSMNTFYHQNFVVLEEHLQPGQLVLIALEEMSSPHPEPAFRRLEEGIYRWLGRKVVLERAHLRLVNGGNDKGDKHVATGSTKPPEGLYAMSNNQPMLQSSKQLIMECWNECGRISQLTGWEYNCSQTLYTTTTDVTAMPQGFLRVVTQEENTAMHDAVTEE
mmetsp:Transcript_25741/g.56970  ORF Transcript_25741/g.56970 Transcript_25741/m.56970 type:complete len:398 (+) Transcript_25741:165-1358(+)